MLKKYGIYFYAYARRKYTYALSSPHSLWQLSRVWFIADTGKLFLCLLLHRLWLLLVFLIELMLFCKISEHRITRRECFLAHSTLRWLSFSIWHFDVSWLLWFLFLDCDKGRWNLPGAYLWLNDAQWLQRVGALCKHALVILQQLSIFC